MYNLTDGGHFGSHFWNRFSDDTLIQTWARVDKSHSFMKFVGNRVICD